MSQRMLLSGNDWQFKEFYGEDWRWRDAHKPDTHDTRHWRTATVPGSIHYDLWQNGEIPNPYFECNTLLIEWVPQRTWIYKKTFFVGEDLRGKHLQLHFEGVDYEAEFFLNGESLGHHVGTYTPAIYDVTSHLQFGADNLISVVIEPAPHEQPQVGRTSKVRSHKSRMTYWWDFSPRMIHIGIWDDVYLQVNGDVRIEDVFVRPQLNSEYNHATINLAIELNTYQQQAYELETTLHLDGQIIVTQRHTVSLKQGNIKLDQQLTIDQPHLWWPNGSGDQPLYQAEVRILSNDNVILDEYIVPFAIRNVRLIPNETSDPTALPYTFQVNGRKVYIKGWNWVPIDIMYGVPRPEKLDHLLRLAQQAHVNLLRVWGGGLIEREDFYNLCDQLGIMVWQEFIQSSSGIDNNPSEDPEFIRMMVHEVVQIIPHKRNHPSLVMWCGGNELQTDAGQPLHNDHKLLAALAETVAQLDPDRIWLPTSPTGPVFMNSLENIDRDPKSLHDVHGPWEYQGLTEQYELYNRTTSLLHSEFGVEGITNLKSLNATIAPDHQWPVTLDNPIWEHLGAWWVKQPTWQKIFSDINDIKTLVHATQFLQAEGLRYAVEANQRRKFQNSGTLPWQFNEPYPMAACTSSVDYYGQAKPVYYAVARAYNPLTLSAKFPTIVWADRDRFEAEIWLNNSYEYAIFNATLSIKLVGFNGNEVIEQVATVNCEANTACQLESIAWSLTEFTDQVFFLDLRLEDQTGKLISQNRYPFTNAANLVPLLEVPMTELTVKQIEVKDDWVVTIANSGAQTAFCIWLEDNRLIDTSGYLYFSDNYFSLFPNETRSITCRWRNVPTSERSLSLSAWNTPEWKQ